MKAWRKDARREPMKERYAQRKETMERVFADAKEKHAMRYTHHRGLAAVTRWVRLKFAAMNLKAGKLALDRLLFPVYIRSLLPELHENPLLSANESRGFLDRLKVRREYSCGRCSSFLITAVRPLAAVRGRRKVLVSATLHKQGAAAARLLI